MASTGGEPAPELLATVRRLVGENGDLATALDEFADDGDLFLAGLTSLGAVRVLMAVEDEFDTELPDEALTRETFRTIASIAAVVQDLVEPVSP